MTSTSEQMGVKNSPSKNAQNLDGFTLEAEGSSEDQDARELAREELTTLYGFDFEEIALRSDEDLNSGRGGHPETDIESRIESRNNWVERAQKLDSAAKISAAPALGLYGLDTQLANAALFSGLFAYTLASLGVEAAVSHSENKSSDYDIIDDEDEVMDFLESRDGVRVDGPVGDKLHSGSEAAAVIDEFLSPESGSSDSIFTYREFEDEDRKRFQLGVYVKTGDLSEEELSEINPEKFLVSGYLDDDSTLDGKSPGEHLERLARVLGEPLRRRPKNFMHNFGPNGSSDFGEKSWSPDEMDRYENIHMEGEDYLVRIKSSEGDRIRCEVIEGYSSSPVDVITSDFYPEETEKREVFRDALDVYMQTSESQEGSSQTLPPEGYESY